MKVIGITGGIGSGKSTIMNILAAKYGVKTVLADELGHKSMEKESSTYQRMIEEFGEEILTEDGEIDRAILAGILYADEEKLKTQNSIVHPFVRNEIERLLNKWESEGERLAAVESAILVEAGCHDRCDEIWFVTAAREIRIERLMSSRGYDRSKAESIIGKQKTDEEYERISDRVIVNDKDITHLYMQLDNIFI